MSSANADEFLQLIMVMPHTRYEMLRCWVFCDKKFYCTYRGNVKDIFQQEFGGVNWVRDRYKTETHLTIHHGNASHQMAAAKHRPFDFRPTEGIFMRVTKLLYYLFSPQALIPETLFGNIFFQFAKCGPEYFFSLHMHIFWTKIRARNIFLNHPSIPLPRKSNGPCLIVAANIALKNVPIVHTHDIYM